MLNIVNINKDFSSHLQVLKNINLEIPEGKFISLLGPSGCGKSTLLRILAGLEMPTSGDVLFNGKSIINVPAQQRPFNMVFQKHALFPHLSVFDNVAFGLKIKIGLKTQEINTRVKNYLALVGLAGFEDRMPGTLSGGQSQRVALARALVNEPKFLLLDEPLSALDVQLKEQMQKELKNIQHKLGITFLLVTHDQDEAFLLSDQIIVMNRGIVEQHGAAMELISNPKTSFVSNFVCGDKRHLNRIAGLVLEVEDEKVAVQLDGVMDQHKVWGLYNDASIKPGTRINAFIRPDKILFNVEKKINE